jgi:hypothetical protein
MSPCFGMSSRHTCCLHCWIACFLSDKLYMSFSRIRLHVLLVSTFSVAALHCVAMALALALL